MDGYGVIQHTPATCEQITAGHAPDEEAVYATLIAADRLASAIMWVVAHMTYAERGDLSGAPLPQEAFKSTPEGHTGGALNVAPADAGYLTANLLTAQTRGWVLGQGHCVAAIEAANCLVDNLSGAQALAIDGPAASRAGAPATADPRSCRRLGGMKIYPAAEPRQQARPRHRQQAATPRASSAVVRRTV